MQKCQIFAARARRILRAAMAQIPRLFRSGKSGRSCALQQDQPDNSRTTGRSAISTKRRQWPLTVIWYAYHRAWQIIHISLKRQKAQHICFAMVCTQVISL